MLPIMCLNAARLALDPGRSRCGWALECQGLSSPLVGEVNVGKLGPFLRSVARFFEIDRVIVGDGTGHREVLEEAYRVFGELLVSLASESGSTEEARRLYVQERGGSWLGRNLLYLRFALAKPPLDGYAAWVLLRRHRPL